MRTIGVKELKKHLSEVLRDVEETEQVIGVSNRGRIVAQLIPVRLGPAGNRGPHATIADLDALAARIGAGVAAGVSVEDAINEIRR